MTTMTETLGYHISASRNRESIETQGLRTDADHGYDARFVWFFVDRTTAESMLTQSWGASRGVNDLWEIDLDGLEVIPDPHAGWGDERDDVARAVAGHISPDRIRLVAHVD